MIEIEKSNEFYVVKHNGKITAILLGDVLEWYLECLGINVDLKTIDKAITQNGKFVYNE